MKREFRLTSSTGFSTALHGRKCASNSLVLHLNNLTSDQNPRIGFIVSKAVGNSVMRHRVTRQLRHLMMSRIDRLHRGDLAVVRALPNAAGLPSQELGIELDHLLSKVDRP